MPHNAAHVPVAVRISSYQIGDREHPRFVWSVGLPVEFINQLPEAIRRVRMSAHDGAVNLMLSEHGIKLSVPPRARTAWAGSIGQHHTAGMTMPTELARSIPVEGMFIPEEGRIELSRNLPDILKNAMLEVQQLEEASAQSRHFPATHFQEDVAAAQAQHTDEPLETPVEEPHEVSLVQAPEGDKALPVNLAQWSDDDVRRLRELMRDMQAQRPDVILTLDGQSIKFERHVIAEF